MVLGEEKVGKLQKRDKKSKKSVKNDPINGLEASAADDKVVETGIYFDKEKPSTLETDKEKDEADVATKAAGGDDRGVKRKKERQGGKHPVKSSIDNFEDTEKSVGKKKHKKLKKRHKDEQQTLPDAPLRDTNADASANEARDNRKVVEKFSDGENSVDEIRRKKKSKKSKKNNLINGEGVTDVNGKTVDGDLGLEEENLGVKGRDKQKKKTKAGRQSDDCDSSRTKERERGKHPEKFSKDGEEDDLKNVKEKKRKKLKKSRGDDAVAMHDIENRKEDIVAEEGSGAGKDNTRKRKKEKVKLGQNSEGHRHEKSKKRVSFSDHVQIFPSSSDPGDEELEMEEENLIRGKRFSKEEDEIVKEAVHKYIEVNNLGEEGLDMILNSRSHPEVKGCWKEIGSAIPYRPYTATYYRAQILFRRSETRKWTEEEYEMVREFQKKHGNQWKVLADELGKHRFHVKDTWRRIKNANPNKGKWTQEEYQTLFDLVNTDLKLNLFEEKKSKHGMLRDNIGWSAISDRLSTRGGANCCMKWYDQLASPMVSKGEWADADDYHLIDALFELDASCIEDVDWDNLLDHRPGDICRKRWNQMVRHIGQYENSSFAEQVEVLAKRYRPDMAEVREAWDSKPVLP